MKGLVGDLVLDEDVGGYHMVIPQVSNGRSGSAIRNVWFGSRIDWGNKCNSG